MKDVWSALALASVMLMAGCSTNSVVRQSYKATTPETYWSLMRELRGAAIHALIDPDTVSWDIVPVQHVSGEERSDSDSEADAEADSLAA